MPEEAPLARVGLGLAPVGDGWFVVNARGAAWEQHPVFGLRCSFELTGSLARSAEGLERLSFPQLGVTLQVIEPGQPSTLYHAETAQEDFLVLAGECTAVVEGQERRLRQWDFLHCPAGTLHAFTGAGDGPCVLLAVGARFGAHGIRYEPTPLATSVEAATGSGRDAYAPYGHWQPAGAPPLP
jgi:uncharacterized cupin superfamily protein